MKFQIAPFLAVLAATGSFAAPIHPDQPLRLSEGQHTHDGGDWESSFEASWNSRYLAEGREVWGDNGIFSGLAVITFQNFTLELWQGFSDGDAGREFQGSTQYTFHTDPVEVTLGLTHINDTRGGDDDLDASISFAGELPFCLEWNASFYHGFERDGSYLEAGISRTWETDAFDFSIGSHFGSNFGYVVDGHRGADHIVLSAEISREISEGFTLRAGYAYHFAIDRNPARHAQDQELYDGSLLGFSAGYSF